MVICKEQVMLDKLTPTVNHMGFDLGVPSDRIEEWVDAYDGVKPLYDFGSGYGTNALFALREGAQVVCLDMAVEHLNQIR